MADLFRLLKPQGYKDLKVKDSLGHKVRRVVGVKSLYWYTWKGYTLDDATKILYYIAEEQQFKRVDPEGAAGRLAMAFSDLNDSIPFPVAATALGFGTPEFKFNGRSHNGATLPFKVHPRLKMYPWIRRPVAWRPEIKELMESGDYELPGDL